MILIYCNKNSPRIEYTFNHIFKLILNKNFSITNSKSEFIDFKGYKFSYANNPISEGATALKLENEIDTTNESLLNEAQYSDEAHQSTAHVSTDNLEEISSQETKKIENEENNLEEPSNGLENFGLQEESSFELFDNNEDQSTFVDEEKEAEEDELEIPAFLRRQKN